MTRWPDAIDITAKLIREGIRIAAKLGHVLLQWGANGDHWTTSCGNCHDELHVGAKGLGGPVLTGPASVCWCPARKEVKP